MTTPIKLAATRRAAVQPLPVEKKPAAAAGAEEWQEF